MEVLTRDDARAPLSGRALERVLRAPSDQSRRSSGTYLIPPDSGRKTALARSIAQLMLRDASACIVVSGWGVWPSGEHLDLFHGYRRSFGEERTLMEAPVHLFGRGEQDAFISILCMALFFVWDASISDMDGRVLVRVSHDEWLETQADDEMFLAEFDAALVSLGLQRREH